MKMLAKWAGFVSSKNIDKNLVLRAVFGPSSIVSIEGFRFIGSIGWITRNFTGAVCGEKTGYMAVKVDY